MNLRRIKHTLLRLTAEEKVIGIGSLIILIGAFLPWYSVVMNFDKKSLTETGFSGDLGVIGFVIFLMGLISLLILVGENMHLPLPQFGYRREQILFFFLGQSFFLTLLTMAIYTKRSLEFTEAGLRFGIYTVLLGAFFGALSAFALIQKSKKKAVEEFFSHEEDGEESKPEDLEVEVEDKLDVIMPEPETMHFEEDAQIMEAAQEASNSEPSDYIPEDDMLEDIQEIDKSESQPDSKMSMNFYQDK